MMTCGVSFPASWAERVNESNQSPKVRRFYCRVVIHSFWSYLNATSRRVCPDGTTPQRCASQLGSREFIDTACGIAEYSLLPRLVPVKQQLCRPETKGDQLAK